MYKDTNQKIYLITYLDSLKYSVSAKQLERSATKTGLFEGILVYTPKKIDPLFIKTYSEILSEPRGGGYWIWKHQIIKQTLDLVKENDIIIYTDAGSTFNYLGIKRLLEYIEQLNDSEFGNFRMEGKVDHIEEKYTSNELFNYFNISKNSLIKKSVQLMGGHLIFQKNSHTKNFLQSFKDVLLEDINLLTDFYTSNQVEKFIENRHDQSIMSLISKTMGCESIANETYFEEFSDKQYLYPFLSVRNYGHGLKDRTKYSLHIGDTYSKLKYF
tara:strand:- start:894 stop:1706 length:813 start_codon:yes stop_codon:yes gene_type:complete